MRVKIRLKKHEVKSLHRRLWSERRKLKAVGLGERTYSGDNEINADNVSGHENH